MNILIVGSGAREHALALALARSPQSPHLYCVGTSLNPGIQALTRAYQVGEITDRAEIMAHASAWQIDIAVIGPEAPLESGVADQLWSAGIAVIGPTQALARIETSKSYARELMQRYAVPGLPRFAVFSSMTGVSEFLSVLGEDAYVIKANGLMGGKGVKVAGEHVHGVDEALTFCQQILEVGHTFVIEEKLIGQEFSFMCFCDGEYLAAMPIVQDHKRAYDDDKGPNTGGMGSYSDANHSLPFLSEDDVKQAITINQEIVRALQDDNKASYVGILYGSFIATRNGVFVIEFNARFGDPEALNVLSILESDLLSVFQSMAETKLVHQDVSFANKATVCKYAVPEGYPDHPVKHVAIDVAGVSADANLYFGAVQADNGVIIATGSRTAACVGVADELVQAEREAEEAVSAIKGPLFHRRDIGTAQLIEKRISHMQALRA